MRVEGMHDRLGSVRRVAVVGIAIVFGAAWGIASAARAEAMAGDSSEDRPARLRPMPGAVILRGPDAVQQLAIDGLTRGARAEPRDVTRHGALRELRPAWWPASTRRG